MVKSRLLRIGVLLGVALLGLILLKTCTTSPYKDKSLLELLVLYRAELDAPGLTIEEASANLKTGKKALAFVRDDIVFVPYEGRQQSPDDVLHSRIANIQDKAALLGALLEKLGWQVSYLDADWPEAKPYVSEKKARRSSSPVLKAIARRIDFDLLGLDEEWQKQSQSLDQTRAQIAASVNAANQVLVDKTGYNPEYATTTGNPLHKRIVVDASLKGRKQRFDPVYYQVPFPDSMSEFSMPVLGTPLIELRLADGSGMEQALLHWSGPVAGRSINLHFLPAIETAKTLAGPADPASVSLWMPVLSVNGELVTGKAFSPSGKTAGLRTTPPILDLSQFKLADPSSATELKVARIETPDAKTVRLSLELISEGDGSWVPAHFSITDNGQLVHPRLLNLEQSAKPIMVLTDVSGSMKDIGAFEISKEAIISLASHLSPATPVALTSFARAARKDVPLSPLGDGTALAKAARQLTTRDYTGIYAGLDFAANTKGLDNGVVILLSDGFDNVGGNEDAIIKALKARNIRVFALALGADSDAKLLQRIAQKTDGFFARIRKADELEPFYARLGSELTSYVALEYDAPVAPLSLATEILPNTTPANDNAEEMVQESANLSAPAVENADESEPANNQKRAVRVQLKGSTLETYGDYEAQPLLNSGEAAQLALHIEIPVGENVKSIDRPLFVLGDAAAPWALMGDYTLISDLGGYGADRLTSAYMTEWINVIRQRSDKNFVAPDYLRPSFNQIQTVNGFRALSGRSGEGAARLGGGPNVYLRRSMISPGNAAPERRRVFDVLFRAQRGYQTDGSYWVLKTSEAMNLEIAGAIAEGWLIGGKNGVDALLANLGSLEIFKAGDPRPDWLAAPLRGIPLKAHAPGYTGFRERLLVSREEPDWAWVIDTEWEHNFRTLYGGHNVLAKGASVEEIAKQFDKIDKMYEIYGNAVGNIPGPYATTGAMLSALVTMKREENKLWCFSTVMMGYVSEAIGDDDALLNRNAQGAKANAAKLCKMKGAPDDGEAFVRNAVLNAARDGANSWMVNITKEGVGGLPAGMHSAAGIGGAVSDAAALYHTNASSRTSPITPGFHRAMAKAVVSAPAR